MNNTLNCFKQYSELAMASYADFNAKDIIDTIDLPASKSFFKKYKVLYHISNIKTGFSATLFEKLTSEEYSEELKDVADKIISFRGTDNIPNDTIYANYGWIINILPIEVYINIIEFIQDCIKQNQLSYNDKIAVTGHSLGGALSQLFYATFYNDFQNIQGVYTFNSPGIVGIKGNVENLFLYLKNNIDEKYKSMLVPKNLELMLQGANSLSQYIDYLQNLRHYLSNNFSSYKVYHFHTGNMFEYEKEVIDINLDLLYKFSHDLNSIHEEMTPDELISKFPYIVNIIQNLNEDIIGNNINLNINILHINNSEKNALKHLIKVFQKHHLGNKLLNIFTKNDRKLINRDIFDNLGSKNFDLYDEVYGLYDKAVVVHDITQLVYIYNEKADDYNRIFNSLIERWQYSHSIISSILVLNFYNYLHLCILNHINGYTFEDYIKLFNLYTYQINNRIFSNDKFYFTYFSTELNASLDKKCTSNSYMYGDYLLDYKYNRPIIDIIKYIYIFTLAYSEHEGIEDENLHNCIECINNILTSEIYDYGNMTIEIINILSKHKIYCKLIYDSEKDEYENTNDISSKFIKYFGASFVPVYKNQLMITEATLTQIFGYDLVEMLKGCDDEYIALFPLQTVSIS